MKTINKIIIAIAVVTASFSAANAQVGAFKTMMDWSFGVGFTDKDVTNVALANPGTPEYYKGYFDYKPMVFSMNVTEGYQISPSLFAGVGFGMTVPTVNGGQDDDLLVVSNFLFPFYADFRWTLDVEKTITPFVDIKIGYQASALIVDGEFYSVDYDNFGKVRFNKGFYFLPTVGLRMGKNTAFNFGVSYNPCLKRSYGLWDRETMVNKVTRKSSKGVISLNLGVEF